MDEIDQLVRPSSPLRLTSHRLIIHAFDFRGGSFHRGLPEALTNKDISLRK